MYTREEFEQLRVDSAAEMAGDVKLRERALGVFVDADRYRWVHQTNWFGEPILQLPQDMFTMQEIIFNTRPEYIVEVGVAWGGSLLFYSVLMEVLGGERIIGIDTYIPDDLKDRIGAFGSLSERITWVQGSSVAEETLDEVRSLIGDSRRVMVNLDSNHTHDHVLDELRRYSLLVGKGQYLVCSDTVLELIPEQTHRTRPWGPGNNPRTALDQFLRENDRFVVDERLDSKLLLTCNPGGYLLCSRDSP